MFWGGPFQKFPYYLNDFEHSRPQRPRFFCSAPRIEASGLYQSRPQSVIPLDQRSENESSGSNHYERKKEITEFWLSGSLRICIFGACLKWLLQDRWSRGTKLWERDWLVPKYMLSRSEYPFCNRWQLVATLRNNNIQTRAPRTFRLFLDLSSTAKPDEPLNIYN